MPKIVNHEVYRKELLHKAFFLFARKGYSKVTIRELAKELEVSTGTLYHYFENKDVLFEQMVTLLANEDVAQLDVMERRSFARTPERIVEVLFQFIETKEFHFQNVILMVSDVYRYNEEGKKIPVLKDCLNIYREAISQHLNLGNVELERLLLSIVIGTIFQRMLDPDEVSYEKTGLILREIYPHLTGNSRNNFKKAGNE